MTTIEQIRCIICMETDFNCYCYEQGKKDERERLLNVWECIAENYSFSDCFKQMREELMKDEK